VQLVSNSKISNVYVISDHNPPTVQTNGRTKCDRKTALCTIVHRAVVCYVCVPLGDCAPDKPPPACDSKPALSVPGINAAKPRNDTGSWAGPVTPGLRAWLSAIAMQVDSRAARRHTHTLSITARLAAAAAAADDVLC